MEDLEVGMAEACCVDLDEKIIVATFWCRTFTELIGLVVLSPC